MRVDGVDRVKAALQKAREKYAKGVERGLVKSGLLLLRYSMQLVPIDTGDLRRSGPAVTRKMPGTSGLNTVMTVGYGTDYAVYVHENLEAKHAEGKVAKFLERPLREHREEMAQIVRTEAYIPS